MYICLQARFPFTFSLPRPGFFSACDMVWLHFSIHRTISEQYTCIHTNDKNLYPHTPFELELIELHQPLDATK